MRKAGVVAMPSDSTAVSAIAVDGSASAAATVTAGTMAEADECTEASDAVQACLAAPGNAMDAPAGEAAAQPDAASSGSGRH